MSSVLTPPSARNKNRGSFPATAKIVDEFRKHFGGDVKLLWAKENGQEIGRRDAAENGGKWITPCVAPKMVNTKERAK